VIERVIHKFHLAAGQRLHALSEQRAIYLCPPPPKLPRQTCDALSALRQRNNRLALARRHRRRGAGKGRILPAQMRNRLRRAPMLLPHAIGYLIRASALARQSMNGAKNRLALRILNRR
jgi:hypothetical protein